MFQDASMALLHFLKDFRGTIWKYRVMQNKKQLTQTKGGFSSMFFPCAKLHIVLKQGKTKTLYFIYLLECGGRSENFDN